MTTPDRGDDFTPTNDDPKTDDTKLEDTSSEELAAATAAEDTAAEDAATAAKEAARDDKGRFIPKARFDEAVTKEREAREAAERRVAELQGQIQQVDRTADVEKLETQLTELRKQERRAIMDGDEDKSIALAGQIDRLNRQISIQEAQHMSNQAKEGAREEIRLELAIEKLEATYPALKQDSETYDQDLVDLVLAKQQQLIARDKMSPSQALIKATNDVMVRVQPAAKADEKPLGGLAGAKTGERSATSKAKAVDAALRTPPDTSDVGLDTDKAGMRHGLPTPTTIEELRAIPEATLKRMRGDML